MFELLKKEQQAAPLTPAERAALKFFWSAILSGLFVGLEALFTSFQRFDGVAVDWNNLLRDAILLAIFTAAHTFLGYVKAAKGSQFSVLTATAVDEEVSMLEQKIQKKNGQE